MKKPRRRSPRPPQAPAETLAAERAKVTRLEAQLRSIVENVSDIIAVVDADRTIRYISPSIERVLGYAPGERLGQPPVGPVHEDDRPRIAAFYDELFRHPGATARISFRARHQDGSWRDLEAVAVNSLDDPAVAGVVVTTRDITERVRAEGRFRSLVQSMPIAFVHFRVVEGGGKPADLEFVQVNPALEALTGVTPVIGRTASDAVPGLWESNPELLRRYLEMARTRAPARFEVYVGVLQQWFSVSAYSPEAGEVVALFDNITERKATDERLRRSEEENRSLVERSPLGIFRSAPDGRLLAVNPALVAMLGYDSAEAVLALRLPDDVYVDPADRRRALSGAAAGAETVVETRWKKQDGSPITVRLHALAARTPDGAVAHYDCFVEDVTAQRALERQLGEAQKLEAVGRLAGGVAHDFNNILIAISGYAEMVLEDLPAESPARADVGEIRAAARRAAALTRELLAFSRRQVLEARVLDVNAAVLRQERILRQVMGDQVTVRLRLSSEPVVVRADAAQLEQVLINLAVNARDAMPRGGELTIETARVTLGEEWAREHPGSAAGPHVLLAVTDTGVGMDAGVLAHVFEPFFTTKPPGTGTGLGLATVYGVVKQSGGTIRAESEPGRGSTFRVYLPAAAEETAAAPPAPARVEAGEGATLLVVDDDASVRRVLARTLAARGYAVLEAEDGRAALEAARAHAGRIDVLLTDLVMPGMTGREVAEAVTVLRPGLAVVFMSGYTDDAALRQGVLEAGLEYLQKPFSAEDLVAKVREVVKGG